MLVSLVIAGVALYSNRGPAVAEKTVVPEPGRKSISPQASTDSVSANETQKTMPPAAMPKTSQDTSAASSPAPATPTAAEPGKQAEPAPSDPPKTPEAETPAVPASTSKPAASPSPSKPEAVATEPRAAEEKSDRVPPPDADTQQKITAQLEEIYKLTERTTPEAKSAAAKELITAADSAEEKPAERFILLRRAAELAASGGDAALMLQALDLLAGQFALDGLTAKEKMLARLGQNARNEAAIESFVIASTAVIEQAVAAERYETALSVAKLAQQVCGQRPAGRPFRKQAAEQRKQVESLIQQRQAIAEAEATLKQKPDDPEANLALGRWYVCGAGDWARALPHLAKGSDAPVKQLAEQELSTAPQKPEDQAKLADGWYDAAKARQGDEHDAFLRHAGTWYEEAQRQVSGGLLRTKIDKRLEEIAALKPSLAASAGSQAEAGKPIARGRWIDLLAQLDLERDGIFGTIAGYAFGNWKWDGKSLNGTAGAHLLLPVSVEGGYDLEVEFVRTEGNEVVQFRLPVGPALCDLQLSDWHGEAHGLARIDGRESRDNPTTVRPGKLDNGRPYRVLVKVRCEGKNAAIEALLNGTSLLRWSGDPKSLSLAFDPIPIAPPQPALGLGTAAIVYRAARFRLITGSASLLPPRTVFMGSKLLAAHLNDLRRWRVTQGQWRVEDGRIVGSGCSVLSFQQKLPANFVLQFKMSALEGMRPSFRVGDIVGEDPGNTKTIIFRPSTSGTPFPYENRQVMQVRLTFRGEDVRLEIDGKPVAQAKRQPVLNEFLWLGSGAPTIPATTAFWDFKLDPK